MERRGQEPQFHCLYHSPGVLRGPLPVLFSSRCLLSRGGDPGALVLLVCWEASVVRSRDADGLGAWVILSYSLMAVNKKKLTW